MLQSFYCKFIRLLCVLFAGYIFFQGLFTFCHIQNVYEKTFYVENNVFTQLAGIALFMLLTALLLKERVWRLLEKWGGVLFGVMLGLMVTFLIWWVTQTVFWYYGDAEHIYLCAIGLLEGDYSFWEPGGYCYSWPFQTTMVLMIALMLKIFSVGASFYVFPFICIFFYAVTILSLYATLRLVYEEKALVNLQGIMLACYFPYAFLALGMYGDPIGYGWGALSIYHAVRYVKRSRLRNLLLSGVFMAMAVCFKLNCSILLVGVTALLFLNAVSRRGERAKRLLLVLVFLSVVFVGKQLPDLCFKAVSGMDMPVGNSRWSHLAMGLQECGKAPGWYNGYNDDVFVRNGYDTQKAAEEAQKTIKKLLGNFGRHPDYAWKFFHKKLASEWNNPTFECFHVQSSRATSRELGSFVRSFLYDGGKLNILAIGFLDIAQTVLLFGILLYFLLEKRADYSQLFWGMLFVGAFVFWMFWEAKARYVAPYFLFLIPYAFMGYRLLVQRRHERRVKGTALVLVAAVVFLYVSDAGWVDGCFKINRDTEGFYEYIHQWNDNFLWLKY